MAEGQLSNSGGCNSAFPSGINITNWPSYGPDLSTGNTVAKCDLPMQWRHCQRKTASGNGHKSNTPTMWLKSCADANLTQIGHQHKVFHWHWEHSVGVSWEFPRAQDLRRGTTTPLSHFGRGEHLAHKHSTWHLQPHFALITICVPCHHQLV